MAQYIENFPAVDQTLGGGNQSNPWTDVWRSGGEWRVTSVGVTSPGGVSRSVGSYARLESVLDGSNMSATAQVGFVGSPQHATNVVAVCARMSTGSVASGYMAVLSGTGVLQIARIDGNTTAYTVLALATNAIDTSSTGALGLTVNGSTLSATWNGNLEAQVIDTQITDGSRAGLYGYERSETVYVEVTNFMAQDVDTNPDPSPVGGRIFVIGDDGTPQPAVITRA